MINTVSKLVHIYVAIDAKKVNALISDTCSSVEALIRKQYIKITLIFLQFFFFFLSQFVDKFEFENGDRQVNAFDFLLVDSLCKGESWQMVCQFKYSTWEYITRFYIIVYICMYVYIDRGGYLILVI